MVCLALATLALDRPGLHESIMQVAEQLFPQSTGDVRKLMALNADRFNARPPMPLGPTGNFPRGTLPGVKDEGEAAIGITVRNGTVLLAFGKPMAWIGFSPKEAREMANALIVKAIEAAKVS